MPKRTNDFQRLIALIEQSLASEGVEIIESAEVDEDGTPRESDILIKATVNRHPVTLAIECRDHKRPQSLEWIDALEGKYRDLRVDGIVAVSSSGFTAPAVRKARRLGIRTLSFQEAMQEDWPTQLNRAASRWFSYHVTRLFTGFYYHGPEPQMADRAYRVALVVDKTGLPKGTVKDLVESLFDDAKSALGESLPHAVTDILSAEGPFSRVLHVFYNADDTFVLGTAGKRHELQGVRLTLICQFEFLESAERHYLYNDTIVTLSTVTDRKSGETRSIGSVEVPAEVGEVPDIRIFEWEPKSMLRWKRLSGAED